MKTLFIAVALIGFGWVTFCNHLDDKRMEHYQCVGVEDINGGYQCVIK